MVALQKKHLAVLRVFYSKINLGPDKATKVVLAAVVLHNMLCTLTITHLQDLRTKLMGIT